MLVYIIGASFASSIISLAGLLFFSKIRKLKQCLSFLVSLSVGTFLGVVFINLLPEALELSGEKIASYYILGGFLAFLLLSHFISVYHHHTREPKDSFGDAGSIAHIKPSGVMVLVGDLFHNFVDGITITAAFMVDVHVGIAATVGVLLHEVPQEIAEFFVLIRSGFSRFRALVYNFVISLSILIGALLSYLFLNAIEGATGPLLGIAAGNLLYVAASDLLPEVFSPHTHGKPHRRTFMLHFLLLVAGIVVIAVISSIPFLSY